MIWSDRLQSIGMTARGYDPEQVRELVWRIDQALSGRIPHAVTASDVSSTAFDIVPDGYEMSGVDAMLSEAIRQLRSLPPPTKAAQSTTAPTQALDRYARVELLRRCWELRGKRFRRFRFGRGYRITEVDDFTDFVAARYGNGMMAKDVQEVLFSQQWRGYDESAVDAWLDAVEELLRSEGR